MTTAPTLRPYQVDAIEACWSAFTQHQQNRVLVKMPTGTGKTVMFAEMLQHYAQRWELLIPGRTKGARMLVIAHREELLEQAAAKILAANKNLHVDIEQGERVASRYADVVVASIQTLQAMRFRRLKRLIALHQFRLVIVDEAHHAAAASYRTALVHLGFLPPGDASEDGEIEAADYDDVAVMERALRGWDAQAPRDRLLVGCTATPNRSDAVGLGCVFQTIAYNYALRQAIEDGYLVPITPWVIESDISLDDVRTTAGDFNQKDLAKAVNQEVRNQLALSAWQEHAEGLSTIAFTVDVAHAHALAEKFRSGGVRAQAISGETPKDDRRIYLRQYTAGQIELLANCMVLTEGTDLPRTQCILHTKPTQSSTLYEQMTGRGLRLFEGKSDCVVIDVVDIARKHSLQTAPVLYGLPPGLVSNGEQLDDLEAALEEFRDEYPLIDVDEMLRTGRLTLEQLRARASTFNVWQVPDLGSYREVVTLNWIKTGRDEFKLSYPWGDGTETLSVEPDMIGKFSIVSKLREAVKQADGTVKVEVRQRTLASDLADAGEGLKMAEQFIHRERRSVARLRAKDAPWRVRPASENQLALLRKFGVPVPRGPLTAGRASDLIDIAKSRRAR